MSDSDAVAALVAAMAPPKGSKTPNAAEDDDEDAGDREDEEDEESEEADEELSGDGANEEDEEPSEDEEEGDDEGNDSDEKGDKPGDEASRAAKDISDDAVVKVSVDGQDIEFTVGNLKRLAGQEASLTRKSQEADLVGGRAAAALESALTSILEDLAPYQELDWVLEGRRMDDEEFTWHRENYTRLQRRYESVIGAAQAFQQAAGERHNNANAEALATMKADMVKAVPTFDDKLYGDIKSFAVASGLNAEGVEGITSAPLLKLLHKAMLYDKGSKAAAEKVSTAPKKVRGSGGREAMTSPNTKEQRVLQKKIASGAMSEDDAVKALLGRWGANGQ